MNAFKTLNAAIVLALMCFVFTSAPLNAVTLEQARRALANVEAKGDFETANLIREAIQQAESPAPVGPSFMDRVAEERAQAGKRLAEIRSRRAPEETGIFDEAAYFLGFGEKAKREKQDKRITSCNAIAADYYQEKLEEAITDPSLWQLGGWESARDYANVDGFRRSCINR
jgi:hypothetical protein